MNTVERAQSLADSGLFNDALSVLGLGGVSRDRRRSADLLRAELLERTGKYQEAFALTESVLRQPEVTNVDQCRCQLTLGRIGAANGDFDGAAGHLQRAISAALAARAFEYAAWSQLRLLVMLFDA